jgi:uncharacterized membrane protein HdeD (DUF308 family)
MRLSERLNRLDNPGSRGILWMSDQIDWWWNLGIGLVLIIDGTVIVVVGTDRSDVIAAYLFGLAALLIGGLLAVGRHGGRRR